MSTLPTAPPWPTWPAPPTQPTRSAWPTWLTWSSKKPVKYMSSTDAMHNPAVRKWFLEYLDNTDPPAKFKASEVAQRLIPEELASMGYADWEDVMPAIVELAFELRATGYCHVLKGGKVLGNNVDAYEIEGDIKVLRDDSGGERE